MTIAASPAAAPNEFRAGWPVVFAGMMGMAWSVTAMPFYTLGVFVGPLSQAFGWSRGEIQAAILFSNGFSGLAAPLVGYLVDRHGGRPIALVAQILLVICIALTSVLAGNLWGLYLAYTLIGFLGGGTSPVTWTRVVNGYFVRRRGLALGLVLAGSGICALVAPTLATWAIAEYGSWKAGYIALALLPLFLGLPLTLLFFRDAQARGAAARQTRAIDGMTVAQAVRQWRFWVMILAFFLVSQGIGGTIPSLIPILTDKGFTPGQAAGVLGLIGVSVVLGRALAGFVLDKVWAPAASAVFMALPIITLILLYGTPTLTVASIAAFIVGFAAGAQFDLVAYLTGRYFGEAHYGKIYAWQYAGLIFSGGVAPFIWGTMFDLTGGYETIMLIVIGAHIFGSLLFLTLGRYPNYTHAGH
jgi:MFS family permease